MLEELSLNNGLLEANNKRGSEFRLFQAKYYSLKHQSVAMVGFAN